MGTFQERVADYLGTVSDTGALSDQLTAGAKYITDIIRPEKIEKFGTDLTDSGTGVTITGLRLLCAHKSYYKSNLIHKNLKARASDSNSRFYASTTSPVHYIDGGKCYVLPSGGTVTVFNYPTVLYSASSISGGILSVIFLSGGTGHAVGDTLTLSTTGSGGTVKVLTVSAGVVTSVILITVGSGYTAGTSNTTSSGSGINCTITINSVSNYPTEYDQGVVLYTVKQQAIAKLNTLVDALHALAYSAPTAPTAPDAFTLSASAPTAPVDASYSYVDAVIGTYTATTIGAFGDVPTYTKPTVSMTTAIDSLDMSLITVPSAPADFSLVSTAPSTIAAFSLVATAPSPPDDASYSYTDATLGTYTATTIASSEVAPTYTKPTTTASFTNANTYIGTDIALAKAQTEINQQLGIIDLYGKDLYNELNEYNCALEVYKVVLVKEIEHAGLEQERLIQTANKTTDLSIQNKAKTLKAASQLYISKLQKYASQIDSFGQSVNAEVNAYKEVLDKYVADLNAFRIKAEAEFQTYQQGLQKYRESVTAFIANYGKSVQQFQGNLAKWQTQRQTELAEYSSGIQNELNEYNSATEVYRGSIQKAIRQAELDQERLLTVGRDTTNLNIQNEIQTLNAAIELYKSKLEKFLRQINLFNAQVNSEVQTYQQKLGKFGGDIQSYVAQIDNARTKYQSDIQKMQGEINHFNTLITSVTKEFEDFIKVIV